MTKITILLPKKRRNDVNRLKWKHNRHKKPFFLTSEINKEVRLGRLDKTTRLFYRANYTNRYLMKKQIFNEKVMWND